MIVARNSSIWIEIPHQAPLSCDERQIKRDFLKTFLNTDLMENSRLKNVDFYGKKIICKKILGYFQTKTYWNSLKNFSHVKIFFISYVLSAIYS